MGQRRWYQRAGQLGRRLTIAERYYERALDAYAKNRLEVALTDLDEAILSDPRNGELYAARGLILFQNNPHREDEAEEDFAQSLTLDPTQWLAYYGRGMIAFKHDDYAAAIDQFSRAARIEPQRPEIYFYRAVSFFRAENPQEAVRDMEFSQKLLGTADSRYKQAEQLLTIFRSALSTPASPSG